MKNIRVGIFGVGRGLDLAKCFMLLNAEILAICWYFSPPLGFVAR